MYKIPYSYNGIGVLKLADRAILPANDRFRRLMVGNRLAGAQNVINTSVKLAYCIYLRIRSRNVFRSMPSLSAVRERFLSLAAYTSSM